jgi:predicted Zn finger-like uncharacterized protein
MSLITRCPTCGTAFRVQPAQLVARSGRVRCGKCSAVFDAVSCLVGEQGAPLTVEPSPQLGLFDPSRRSAAADTTLNLDLSTAAPAASLPPPAAARPSAASPARPPPPSPSRPPPLRPPPSRPSASSSPPPSPPSPSRIRREEPEEMPEFLEDEAPVRRFTVLWGLLALVAFVALAGQLALYFRNELALVLPAARPQLAAACDIIGCTLRLPHRADLMSIESSDLQAEPGRENVIVLNALIRNRAGYAQEYPELELTLTDETDQPVVRRVLKPSDYLDPARAEQLIARGIGPGSELSVRMRFDAGRLRATGFRLFLFFP